VWKVQLQFDGGRHRAGPQLLTQSSDYEDNDFSQKFQSSPALWEYSTNARHLFW